MKKEALEKFNEMEKWIKRLKKSNIKFVTLKDVKQKIAEINNPQ